jgi:hypothetical protein
MTICGNLCSTTLTKGSEFNIWRHLRHPLAAPRLGITALVRTVVSNQDATTHKDIVKYKLYCFSDYTYCWGLLRLLFQGTYVIVSREQKKVENHCCLKVSLINFWPGHLKSNVSYEGRRLILGKRREIIILGHFSSVWPQVGRKKSIKI